MCCYKNVFQDTDCAAAALLATQQLLERQSVQLLTPASPDKHPGEPPHTPIIASMCKNKQTHLSILT